MPEQYTETVRAAEVRKGDDIIENGVWMFTVGSVDVKTKYTTIVGVVETNKRRLANDAPVTVGRTRPTETERRAERVMDTLCDLDEQERRDRKRLAELRKTIADDLIVGRPLQPHAAASLLNLQERAAIWDTITTRSLNLLGMVQDLGTHDLPDFDLKEYATTDEVPTRLDVVRTVRDHMRKELLRTLRFDSLSTSVPANFGDAMRNQAIVDWLEDQQWGLDLLDEN